MANDLFNEGMMKIASIYVGEFRNEPEKTLQMFCRTTVPLMVMCGVYEYLVRIKEMTSIENLEESYKEKLWEQAKQTCPSATKDKTVQLCKGIWLLNFILEK